MEAITKVVHVVDALPSIFREGRKPELTVMGSCSRGKKGGGGGGGYDIEEGYDENLPHPRMLS